MTQQTYFLIIAAVLLGLVPLVPKMVALRTKVLYGLHMRSFAGWHEKNAGVLVVVVRSIFTVAAVTLAALALVGR